MVSKTKIAISAFISVSFAINMYLIINYAEYSGDGQTYLKVARNLYLNSCVSLSDPVSGACVPHWGGNQGPGYPLFISSIWAISFENIKAVLAAQVVFYCAALYRFISLILKIENSPKSWLVSAIIALSPVTIGWPRFILTETIVISLSLFMVTVLLEGYIRKELNVFLLVLIFCCGFFVRYDFVLWSIPILIVCIYSYSIKKCFFYGTCFISVFILVVSLWSYGNHKNGLSLIPGETLTSGYITADPEGYKTNPTGYIKWVETWSWNNYMYPSAVYPMNGYQYKNIILNEYSFADSNERTAVMELIDELKDKYNGQPFPKHIDAEFRRIAMIKRANSLVNTHWTLPAKRIIGMVFNPLTSMGLPGAIEGYDIKDTFLRGTLSERLDIIKLNINEVLIKMSNFIYRILLFGVLSFYAVNYSKVDFFSQGLLLSASTFLIIKVFVFSQTYINATRHLVQPLVFIECALAFIYVTSIFRNKRV